MMNTIGGIYFSLCAIACLTGAIITVLARNPIRGAMGLLTTILGIAGLFLMLGAQFLAAIQVIVYAGAVVVLFVFVILLLGVDANDPSAVGKSILARIVGSVTMVTIAGSAVYLMAPELGEHSIAFPAAPATHGTTAAVGTMLFTRGVVPFELATALLIVAVVGAIAMARGKAGKKHTTSVQSHATLRLFHGPVHPRDAGHPMPKATDR
jgi:NADH-quinone oxidoreductase subunit J